MQSVVELEKKVEALNDQIGDIFHATKLNLEALEVQLQSYNESKMTLSTLAQCTRDFTNIQQLFQTRGSLRLQYLITQQIKQEEAKVRRQRLVEYEQKIYDQRRLISDKEAFFEGLLKPRKKRPAHMTIEQFQAQRKVQILMEQRKNLRRLEEETSELKLMEKALAANNSELEKLLLDVQNGVISSQQLERLQEAIGKNPLIYEQLRKMPERNYSINDLGKLYKSIVSLQESGNSLHSQYLQQKQLHHYLKWQHDKLKQQYLSKGEEKIQNQLKFRKKLEHDGKYRLKRSCSL